MPDRIPVLEQRVERVESAITVGLENIEKLIRREIQDLKAEQLRDIKLTIDRVERDLKNDHGRLADDQRRAWEAIRELEKKENMRAGGGFVLKSAAHWIVASVGGGIGAIMTWLLHR